MERPGPCVQWSGPSLATDSACRRLAEGAVLSYNCMKGSACVRQKCFLGGTLHSRQTRGPSQQHNSWTPHPSICGPLTTKTNTRGSLRRSVVRSRRCTWDAVREHLPPVESKRGRVGWPQPSRDPQASPAAHLVDELVDVVELGGVPLLRGQTLRDALVHAEHASTRQHWLPSLSGAIDSRRR